MKTFEQDFKNSWIISTTFEKISLNLKKMLTNLWKSEENRKFEQKFDQYFLSVNLTGKLNNIVMKFSSKIWPEFGQNLTVDSFEQIFFRKFEETS